MQTFFQCWNIFSCELQWKRDAECYDKFMDIYPNYPKIWWYNLVLAFKKAKEYLIYKTIFDFSKCLSIRKTKSRLANKNRGTTTN
ncbi:MAG TPA: hypothetical protein VFP49_11900 [Nitrososphaeraceae archaeon]|nr:hypothetical protein [Nitrososphaeraceae archaeon]